MSPADPLRAPDATPVPALAGPAGLPTVPAEVAAREAEVAAFVQAEKAAATRRAYRANFDRFVAWCTARGTAALPPHRRDHGLSSLCCPWTVLRAKP